jgi:hypothetical protein
MGRRAIGCDINPVAYCVSRAKTQTPPLEAVRGRLDDLRSSFRRSDYTAERMQLPNFFGVAYHGATLDQLLHVRRSLQLRDSETDCMIAALALARIIHEE